MVRRLDMHKTQGIGHLYATGMSKRKIAKTLGIHRKSVDRHLSEFQPKGASSDQAPTGEALTGSQDSKGANAPTGSDWSDFPESQPVNPAPKPDPSRSQCALAHELFHLLTWKLFRKGDLLSQASQHEEKLAQCFAGSLLVPSEPLRLAIAMQLQGKKSLDFDDLFEVARQFDVSVQSLVWQMVNNRIIDKSKASTLLEKIQGRVSLWEKRKDENPPPARPIRYQALAREAVEKGMIGTGVFAKYMGISRRVAMKIIETEIYTGTEYQASAEIEIVDP